MSPRKLILTLLLMAGQSLSAQNPLQKQWDSRFGGTSGDSLSCFIITNDEGFLLGGYSRSGISGDKTQSNQGGGDYWIIKIDKNGNKEWDRTYGGTDFDYLSCMQQLSDNSYILAGWSRSDANGDKSEPNWDTTHITSDYWLVKIDSAGNKFWDKRYGGVGSDFLNSIRQTPDKGFIMVGETYSTQSGDVSEPNHDTTCNPWCTADIWVIKTDSTGQKQWDRRYGGSGREQGISIKTTLDNSFIIGGASSSQINGDKSQTNYDSSGFTRDYWIVKIDSIGNKIWDKTLGGNADEWFGAMTTTNDGGLIAAGISGSGISGDKSETNWGPTGLLYFDYWIIKIDSLANKQWDKHYGGFQFEDDINSIYLTKDSAILLGGTSYSGMSGDKSEQNLGDEQTWVLKLDPVGNKIWDKTLHTSLLPLDDDEIGLLIESPDGCYIIANWTDGWIGGDNSHPNYDSTNRTPDYWIIKYCDTTLVTGYDASENLSAIDVYPNPFHNHIYVSMNASRTENAWFNIYNVLGKRIYSTYKSIGKGIKIEEISMQQFPAGLYFIEIFADKVTVRKKIIKQ